MATEVRQGIVEQQREVGAGGEEIYEVEKGVRVRKSGGVEFAPTLSTAEIEARRAELSSAIEHQKLVISRAKEEAALAARQANEQEILAREALEIKEFNRNRQAEAAEEARELMIEVTALIDREKELERQRAAIHHAAVEKERERVQAKTAEIIAREEAIEAEKREQFYNELIRKCQALTLRYKLEEEQAKLKLESLQFSLQHGEFRTAAAANRAKITVEVAPRELPEARQFDTSQVEMGIASATMGQEGVATIADTRSIEEIVMTERKHRTSATYASRGIKSEESLGLGERRDVELREELPGSTTAPTSIVPPPVTSTTPGMATGMVQPGENIKVLPDIKPTAAEAAGYGQQQLPMASGGQYQAGQQAMQAQLPQQQQQPFYSQPQGLASGTAQQQQGQFQQPSLSQAAQQEAAATTAAGTEKKQKSGGFFSKFKSSKSHEQH